MNIIIVDDHWAVRDGLKWALSDEPDITVIGEAASVAEVLTLLEERAPDVVVLDIQMPDRSGLDGLSDIRRGYPGVRVVMLSMHDDPLFARKAIEGGADGFVLKSAGSDELIRALRVVTAGGSHFQGEVTRALLASPELGATSPTLSPREAEILQLVSDGFETKQIARSLEISETTVKTHLRRAFERLGARTRSEAVATALREGLID